MRTAPERGGKRGKGPAWVLATLGTLLILAALAVTALDHRTSGAERQSGPAVGSHPTTPAAPERPAKGASASPALAASTPVRLTIPALGVNAPILAVESRGTVLAPPDDPRTLGWWRSGGVPGAARGTTVITGHTVHTGGGVFDHLDDLGRGALVRVTTGKGMIEYRVTSVSVYSRSTLATRAGRLFSSSAAGRLALVTCEDWNGTTYDSNAVVLATPVRGA